MRTRALCVLALLMVASAALADTASPPLPPAQSQPGKCVPAALALLALPAQSSLAPAPTRQLPAEISGVPAPLPAACAYSIYDTLFRNANCSRQCGWYNHCNGSHGGCVTAGCVQSEIIFCCH